MGEGDAGGGGAGGGRKRGMGSGMSKKVDGDLQRNCFLCQKVDTGLQRNALLNSQTLFFISANSIDAPTAAEW